MSAAEFTRAFDPARQEQGFVSQAHLDAFFALYDHGKVCPVCSRIAGYFDLDDGRQPYMGRCDEGKRLDRLTDRARLDGAGKVRS